MDLQIIENLSAFKLGEKVSKLIYETDVEFYELFSKNKIKVLEVIENLAKDKKSDVGNIRIFYMDDHIIGLYCWYKSSEMWQRQMHSLKHFLNMDGLNSNVRGELADFRKQLTEVDNDSLYLSKFVVSKKFRNLGVSKLLIKDFELTAKNLKCGKTVLHVKAINDLAIKVYKGYGYVIDKKSPHYFVMEKDIR